MNSSPTGTIAVIRAKLHDIRVTDADIDYQGSVTLDPEHCEAVGIVPLEFVEIWNKNSGARLTTYVIWGQRGSRCCVLNGAAARTCQPGDPVIIVARTSVLPAQIESVRPRIAIMQPDNRIGRLVEYRVSRDRHDRLQFRAVSLRSVRPPGGRVVRSARAPRRSRTR
ncbi:MAG TPA: aspartate 1-decarboxylase [Steroidobacteraceae bacterium]|jgi:aspartate 1-decarboxylase|nr:aspartate 1-decarboxylase [Steroidobacteraceae bacterium]